MNIKATTKMDLDTMKALTKITMFGKRNAIKRMLTFTVIYALIIALEIWTIITFEVRATNVLILVIATVAITINPLLYFTMPKLGGTDESEHALKAVLFGNFRQKPF